MSYQKTTISAVIDKISHNQLYLPAIQRKYIWSEEQIIKLMDSILRGYPFGTFLFWKVEKATVNQKQYSMYHFIKNYHERDNCYNEAAQLPFAIDADNPDKYVISALDGQQRLTSLYIVLMGSLSLKIPRKHWDNNDAFPKKELYLDLHSKPALDTDISYDFAFLTAEKAKKNENNKLWYRVKDIVQYTKFNDVAKWLNSKNLLEDDLAVDNITALFNAIKEQNLINYFEVESENIDDVLDIFVRVNSGGTVLSKSDLLFSTIVSYWDNGREEIDFLLREINNIGEHYSFSNDFIMRICLYVMDLPVSLKVAAFGKDNVLQIKDHWTQIKAAVKDTITLLSELGFNAENIIAANAILPLIYYRYKFGNTAFNDDKDYTVRFEMRKYLVLSQLRRIFGQATNTTLENIRAELTKHNNEKFQLAFLQHLSFAGEKALKFTAEDIENWFDEYEKNAYTFMLLSLLYPNLKYSQNGFHQDHMHPYAAFEKDLSALRLPDGSAISQEKLKLWKHQRNTLANLQLLEGKENSSKKAMPLEEWLKIPANRDNVKYLPQGISYKLENFEQFLEKRKERMLTELEKILIN